MMPPSKDWKKKRLLNFEGASKAVGAGLKRVIQTLSPRKKCRVDAPEDREADKENQVRITLIDLTAD